MAFQVMAKISVINPICMQTVFRGMSAKMSTAASVGFIGIGNMGSHMASHLMNKGYKLHVYDISKAACEKIQSKGATVYDNVNDLAKKSEFVITMLPNNEIVSNTYHKICESEINEKTIFIDSSTIDPNLSKSIQKLMCSKGARFIDAPVSGGVPGAEQATLTFMVGAKKEEYEAVKSLLECMGKRITHCGGYGMGQAAKLCNNMMLAISMIGVSEAMNLAIRLGLNAQTFAEIINSSTGRCWASELYNPVPGITPTAPANNDYKGGFTVDLISKDLGLASGIATASNSPIPLGALAHQIYRALKAHGYGTKDFSSVYAFLKNDKFN